MPETTFPASEISCQGVALLTARSEGRDLILARHGGRPLPELGLAGAEPAGDCTLFPASLENMLIWERRLAPARRLEALNQAGYRSGFGAGNRIVAATPDLPGLRDTRTFGGWDGIYRGLLASSVPFWFVQQSIVRELIPEGVSPAEYPGIGHTGGYGPRELLRAGLFAFASLGGYRQELPIGADADHAIVVGHDEGSLERSLAFNKLAISESRDYTKFTVDTSHLFDFPVSLSTVDERRLRAAFRGRRFEVANILPGRPGYGYSFDEGEVLRLGRRYWRACAVHKEIYDHVARERAGQPFDYELSLDETPEPTPPRDLLFYLVLLQEVMGLPAGGVASAGPNIGFIKRHDYEGDPQRELSPQVNACASILQHFGAMLSVHSADGVRASTGKGPGVDGVLAGATSGRAELKVADVYQEVLWQVLAASPEAAEREIFQEAWRRTYEAAQALAAVYRDDLSSCSPLEARQLLATAAGRERIASRHGVAALELAQGVIGYGLPVFRLAADLLPVTDPARPSADSELFRRFMYLTFRGLRSAIFGTLGREGWERLAAAIDEATLVRLRAMGWAASSVG